MKAVLFDLDGVVVYTDAYHYRAWKRLADEEGWRFDETLNDRLRGVSRLASLEIILEHNGVELTSERKEEFAARKNEYYKALLETIDETALVPGALDFIRALRREKVLIGLGSSCRNAQLVLDKLGIAELFDAAVTGNDITRSKPDPEIFLLGARMLGVEPAECVVFEDAPSGVEAALAGGMTAVGFGPTEGLEAADILVASYDRLDYAEFLRRLAAR